MARPTLGNVVERCSHCKRTNFTAEFRFRVCPSCGHHFPLTAAERFQQLCDPGDISFLDADLRTSNPLGFPGYADRVAQLAEKQIHSAAVTACANIGGTSVVIAVTDPSIMAGAMGSVVGERLVRCMTYATDHRLPLVLISGSGAGAMMQEGLVSLYQMPQTVAALNQHKQAGLCSVVVQTDATFGGVAASWASMGSITIAEPGARIGFVGTKVSQGIFGAAPSGFRTAEYQLKNGMLDAVVPRAELRAYIVSALRAWGATPSPAQTMMPYDPSRDSGGARSVAEVLEVSANPKRPKTLSYVHRFDAFLELHGDRALGDDGALVGGVAVLAGRPVVFLGHQKNSTMQDHKLRNYGIAGPAGYHKALRLMELAAVRGCPLVCFVDTPGADISVEAEAHGISYMLARCQERLATLPVPVVSVILGEGGSGGAVALAVSDQLLILEYATYSVITPGKCAAILWEDEKRKVEAAEALRLGAHHAHALGVVDHVVAEPEGGAHMDHPQVIQRVLGAIDGALSSLAGKDPAELLEERYQRLRRVNTRLFPAS